MNDMNELVLDFLQDIYYAERAGNRALAKMARAAEADALKGLLTDHRKLSETQVSRLEDVFGTLNERPKAKQCTAMDGLIHEAEDCIEHSGKGPVLDAALIACAQAMDHYEIARYGALIAWMGTMGNEAGVEILRGILAEEKEADARFNDLALTDVNPAANEEKPAGEGPEPVDGMEPEPEPEPTRAKAPRKAADKAPVKSAKAKAATTPRAKKAAAKDPEPEAPEPVADEPEAPEPAEMPAEPPAGMEATPAPAAKRKGPARKKAAAPEPEPEAAEPEPVPAAKPKRGRPRAKA